MSERCPRLIGVTLPGASGQLAGKGTVGRRRLRQACTSSPAIPAYPPFPLLPQASSHWSLQPIRAGPGRCSRHTTPPALPRRWAGLRQRSVTELRAAAWRRCCRCCWMCQHSSSCRPTPWDHSFALCLLPFSFHPTATPPALPPPAHCCRWHTRSSAPSRPPPGASSAPSSPCRTARPVSMHCLHEVLDG